MAEWITCIPFSRPPPCPPSELEKLVTRPRRWIAVLEFTMNPNVVNPSNHWAIFQQYLSVVLNCCFGHTVIPHVSVLLSMSHWTEIMKSQISFGWISLQIRYFFFLAAGIYCKYISLNTLYLLPVSFVPGIRELGGNRWWQTVCKIYFTATSLPVSYEGKSLEKYHVSLLLYAQPQRCIVTNTPDLSHQQWKQMPASVLLCSARKGNQGFGESEQAGRLMAN